MLFAQLELLIFMAGVFLFVGLVFIVVFTQVFAPWLQAFMAGVHLSVLDIVGMRLRKTDVRAVVRALVMAGQAGLPVSKLEMERAYLQGADLEKITLALIQAKKDGIEATFQELVEADLEDRLREKLGR